ncbi:hypothetical protein PAHAL_5G310300 [Panicum hallii]|uniref:Uncharacterized protein n=1 Tax=Panicum hallii TaxID=206008 RepID=A0A2S3HVL3_9POAL|nr:hypothetical protein PAHAL_5G310300 [Panicum hallii]
MKPALRPSPFHERISCSCPVWPALLALDPGFSSRESLQRAPPSLDPAARRAETSRRSPSRSLPSSKSSARAKSHPKSCTKAITRAKSLAPHL